MSKKNVWSLLFALIVILLVAQVASAADCGSLVAGRKYAQQFGGFFVPGTMVPNAGGGYWQFNANGTFTGSVTLALGATPEPFAMPAMVLPDMPVSGTYQLSWDPVTHLCAGSAHETTMVQNFQLIVNGDGASVEFMHTDMGLATGFTGYPMATGKCKKETLVGAYSYNAKGWIAPPPGMPTPPFNVDGLMSLNFSGVINFDGKGSFSGSDRVSIAGALVTPPGAVPRTFTGTYTVGSSCVATMEMVDSIGNPPIHTEVFILQKGRAIQVVNIDDGTVLAFTATKAVED